ncbi:MAG: tetratricopeptide repeat protein [Fimbriimonas sp.]
MKLRWIAVPLVLVAALAASHTYQVIEGVHFKAQGKDVDFGLPPNRYSDIYATYLDFGEKTWRPGTEYLGEEGDGYLYNYGYSPRRANQAKLYRRARNAEARGDYPAALATYREMTRRGLGSPGFVRERIDLLKETGGRRIDGLAQYLRATAKVGSPTELAKTADPTLAPFVAYEEARRAYGAPTAASRFIKIAEDFPDSSRAPAALITASRKLTQGEGGRPSTTDLRLANHAVHTLLARYPKSRFTWSARGERGRIEFLQRRYSAALVHYERQLRDAKDQTERRKALTSILLTEETRGRRDLVAATCLRLLPFAKDPMYVVDQLGAVLSRFDAKDASRFGTRLRQNSKLLEAYLEYRVDFTEPTKDLFQFATTPGISSRSLARLGSVGLTFKDAARARRYARMALAKPDGRDGHALATFTLATLDRRAGRKRTARDRYASVLQRWPGSYLVGGARENLALLEEQLGNLDEALDHYTELKYREDFAYMVDARMSSRQLAAYIRSRPNHPKRSTLIYTLGMRYLREARWSSAEQTFARLSRYQRRTLTNRTGWARDEGGLQDPLATLRALRGLDRQFRRAKTRAAKAAALYATGDYYYTHRHLLLYSPPAWLGVRSTAFSYSWNASVAQPLDDRALKRHHDEHEAVSQALRRFRRVVREYPETAAAPKAAYWAACADIRLAGFSGYWRWRDDDFIGEAVRMMRFAERAKDPVLAQRARKYHRVFRDRYTSDRMAFSNLKAPERRYTGGW